MRILSLSLLLLGLVSCTEQKAPEIVAVKRSYAYPQVSSEWLNTAGRLYTERRAVSPDGIDIRAAAYLLKEQELQMLIQLRNYDARLSGEPDFQWLELADSVNQTTSDPQLQKDRLPLRLLPRPDHMSALLQCGMLDEAGKLQAHNTVLQTVNGAGEVAELPGSAQLYPVRFDADGLLHAWKLSEVQIDKGLIHSQRDYGAGEQFLNADGSAAARQPVWLSIVPDPVSPARSSVRYLVDLPDNNLDEDVEWSFPYHMSYSSESWLPPLFSCSDGRLATLLFQPDATGPSSRASYNGIFRLATLDPADGAIRLLEEDMPPSLNILQQDDVLFFCRPTNGSEAVRWEIWATDPSGLHKRRLYDSDDSVYLNLADVAGDRLLFFRQFFARTDTAPVLFSELLEVSTQGLGKGLVQIDKRVGEGSAVVSDGDIPPISF